MAKKSRKRPARFEKHQSGCMWNFINILNFRNSRSSQKLLPDRKRGGKRIVGTGYPEIMMESLGGSCEICKEINVADQSARPSVDSSKMSVKELMEEEMFGEKDQKKFANITSRDTKQTSTLDEGHAKKNHGRTRSKIDLDSNELVSAEDLPADEASHEKNKTLGSVDLNVMVQELCSRINENDVNHFKSGQDGELVTLPVEDPSVLEEKLCEATKVLVNHFTGGKSFNKDGKIKSSGELVDALRVLNSNKEAFRKLLKDPDSLLAKHIQMLQDIQVEEGKPEVITGSDILEQSIGNGKQNFWRRFRSLERNSSKTSETSEDLNRIVVLKPSALGSRSSETVGSSGSFSESSWSVRDKAQGERVPSPFSFAELKRRLKYAMRKEHHQSSNKTLTTNRDKKFGGETGAIASPSRDHFFIERIPKSSPGLKKADKPGKLNDAKMHLENDATISPEQRVSNIYAEAKKHLAEIVGNADLDVDTHSKQVPKPLGRIISFSGCSSPAIFSPRIDGNFRPSLDGECENGDEKTCRVIKQTPPSNLGRGRQKSENGNNIISDKPNHEAEVSVSEPHFSEERASSVNSPSHEAEISATKAVDTNVVRSSDAEESNLIEISVKSCALKPDDMGETVDSSEEKYFSTSLKQHVCDESETSTSPMTSLLTCSVSDKMNDVDIMSDATSKPSPVSVLEPIFREDDISPPGHKSYTVIESFQPRQIDFEAEIMSPFDRTLYSRHNPEDNKYTIAFVRAVVQMSGLTWDELLNRSLFSDHLVDPELIDEVDFLPDLLLCDFNLLFHLINEVLIEMCWVNFACTLSFAKPFVQPESKGQEIFTEIWKKVEWYLKLDAGPPPTLEQIVAKDFAKPGIWMDLKADSEGIGMQVQEAILEELMEEFLEETDFPVIQKAEDEDGEASTSCEM